MPPKKDTNKKIARFYLFYGPNDFRLDERVSSLIKAVITPGAEAFDLDRFDGKGCDINAVINAVSTPPVISPLHVIILTNLEKLSMSNQNMLAERLLPKIPEYSVLAMTALKPDRRSKLFKQLLADKTNSRVYDNFEPNEAAGLSMQFATNRGKKLSGQVATILVETFGVDAYRLENEVEKLCLYVGDKSDIDKKDLAFSSGFDRIQTAVDLPDLIFDGRLGEALELSRRALASGITETQMLYILKNYLLAINAAQISGNMKSLFGILHADIDRVKEVYAKSRSIKQDVVIKGLTYIFRAEYSLKSARFPSEAIVEALIVALSIAASGNIPRDKLYFL